jgi:hypothetical protein
LKWHDAGEVILRNRWLPVAILVIFLLVSVAALAGLGRNIAQKRDAYSDPLCKAFSDKTPQAVSNMAAKIEERQKKSEKKQFSTGHKPYGAIGKNLSDKYRAHGWDGTSQSMKTLARTSQPRQHHLAAVASLPDGWSP